MFSKALSTIGITFVASLLLLGCDEAAEEASKPEPMKQEQEASTSSEAKDAASGSEGTIGTKALSAMTEAEKAALTPDERKRLELVEELHEATACGSVQSCREQSDVNLYAIKDEKAEVEGTGTLTRTNDGRNRGSGLWSKLKKKKEE